jgi:hypothetical protein
VCATLYGGNIIPAAYRQPDKPYWEGNTCRTFMTRFEALTVRADMLRDVRMGEAWCAAGLMVERFVEGGGFALTNDTVVYFNALRPECYGFPSTHQR